MNSIYETLWLESSTKAGVSMYHVGKLVELLGKHVNLSELSSYDRNDVEIALDHARAFLEKDKADRAKNQEYVNSLIEKWEAEVSAA